MIKPAQDTEVIARSAGKVGVAVMCSRVLGLIREQVFAGLFGAGHASDAFIVAFRIPNLLRDLLAEGALSAAFVAVFSSYDRTKGIAATWRLANNVLVFITILLSLIVIIGMLLAAPIIALLAPGFDQVAGKMEMTRLLTVTMFPFLLFVSLASVVMGVLNTKGSFFLPALSSSFFNMGAIVFGGSLALILPYFGQPAIMGMAIGTLIGGFLQFAGQLPSLFKVGFVFRPFLDLADPGLRRILKLMVPAIIGLSATQINIFINTNFAASLVEGSVSWLNYAFRLVQLPIGVFGVALAIATLPVIARHAATKDFVRLKETYVSSLTMGFCLTIPATVGLFVLAEPVIRVIFEHGAFSAFDTVKTAEALSFYTLGLFAYAAVKIMVPVFYALDSTRYPVIGSFLAVAVNIVIILLTIDLFEHRAIALATSCAMFLNFLFLSIVLYRKLAGYALDYLFVSFGKIILASTLMGGWLIMLQGWLVDWQQYGLPGEIGSLFLSILSGLLIYSVLIYVLKVREVSLLINKIKGGSKQLFS